MQTRALFAFIIALAALAAGAVIIASQEGAGLADFLDIIFRRAPEVSLLCVIAGWAALLFALLALLAAIAFFWVDEDEEMTRRGGAGAPLVLLLVSFVFFWLALRCPAAEEGPAPLPEPAIAAPEPEPEPEAPVDVEVDVEEEAPPAPERQARAIDWEFMIPLIGGEGYRQTPSMEAALSEFFAMDDPGGKVRALLCGKAWIAFAGASSEEGPRERNERRARIRAELVLEKAQSWLDAHAQDCERPVLFGIDLGQHQETGAGSPDGALTFYQRQTLIVARERAPGEAVAAGAAEAELRAYLADEETRRAFLAGRRYMKAPEVFVPGAQY